MLQLGDFVSCSALRSLTLSQLITQMGPEAT